MHGVEGGRIRVQFFAIGQRAEEGVAGKFGVQLPAHAEGAGVDHQVRIGAFDGGARMPLAQLAEIVAGGRRLFGAVLEGQVRDRSIAPTSGTGAGVELVVQALAEGVPAVRKARGEGA